MSSKYDFKVALSSFAASLTDYVSTSDGQWTVKGFIDSLENVYTISGDTKVVSKILEIHLLPRIIDFAKDLGFRIVLPQHQDYYPDISFVDASDDSKLFALDFKTTYRIPDRPWLCNGFTLGSHGTYFSDRQSRKNIQFPYASYVGHFCLGIIYDRVETEAPHEATPHSLTDLHSIQSVISNIQFFVAEKWKIASDKGGSGNTANIGSIRRIEDIITENGMFSLLGEEWFDDYWMNYDKIAIVDSTGKSSRIRSLEEFVKYRNGDTSLIVHRNNQP